MHIESITRNSADTAIIGTANNDINDFCLK